MRRWNHYNFAEFCRLATLREWFYVRTRMTKFYGQFSTFHFCKKNLTRRSWFLERNCAYFSLEISFCNCRTLWNEVTPTFNFGMKNCVICSVIKLLSIGWIQRDIGTFSIFGLKKRYIKKFMSSYFAWWNIKHQTLHIACENCST